MKSIVSALLIGIVFGLGITISGMINPAKVLNFFDLAGNWDPSLAFVMGGGLVTAMVGYRLVFGRMKAPVFGDAFAARAVGIDRRLVGGAIRHRLWHRRLLPGRIDPCAWADEFADGDLRCRRDCRHRHRESRKVPRVGCRACFGSCRTRRRVT